MDNKEIDEQIRDLKKLKKEQNKGISKTKLIVGAFFILIIGAALAVAGMNYINQNPASYLHETPEVDLIYNDEYGNVIFTQYVYKNNGTKFIAKNKNYDVEYAASVAAEAEAARQATISAYFTNSQSLESTESSKYIYPGYYTAYIANDEDDVVEYLGRNLESKERYIPLIAYDIETARSNIPVTYYILINTDSDYQSRSLLSNEQYIYTDSYVEYMSNLGYPMKITVYEADGTVLRMTLEEYEEYCENWGKEVAEVTVEVAGVTVPAGPPEQAPQASIRGSADTINGDNVLKLEHQGGEAISLTDAKTKVIVDGNAVSLSYLTTDSQFDAGETLYIYINTNIDGYYLDTRSNTIAVDDDDIKDITTTGSTVNVKIVDIDSQQMIADLKVNF